MIVLISRLIHKHTQLYTTFITTFNQQKPLNLFLVDCSICPYRVHRRQRLQHLPLGLELRRNIEIEQRDRECRLGRARFFDRTLKVHEREGPPTSSG